MVELAPDTKAERDFLPKPPTLKDRLLLADRGYPSVDYFSEVRAEGGNFVVRITSSYTPWVRAAWIEGERRALTKPVRLSQVFPTLRRVRDAELALALCPL